jgi:predicted DCC family thiol-disulfide oxidoreductase YuxK
MDTRVKYENIILIDGNCALCHAFVRWIIKNKKEDADIRFSALQHIGLNSPDSVVLLKNGFFYYETDVLTELRDCLKFKARIRIHLLRILPKKLRNYFYKFIARRRYQWFGKIPEKCYVEDKRIRSLWLAEDLLKKMISVQDLLSQKGTSNPSKSLGRKG